MNKEALLKLNCVPEGKAAWLHYRSFRKLRELFEELPSPKESFGLDEERYSRMHDFLLAEAGIEVPESQEAVHLNAFILLRRGYKPEDITASECEQLRAFLEPADQPDPDDMELHDYGAHRDLYIYLTEQLGIYVEAGRGPVWFRAQQLVLAHEKRSDLPVEAS